MCIPLRAENKRASSSKARTVGAAEKRFHHRDHRDQGDQGTKNMGQQPRGRNPQFVLERAQALFSVVSVRSVVDLFCAA